MNEWYAEPGNEWTSVMAKTTMSYYVGMRNEQMIVVG